MKHNRRKQIDLQILDVAIRLKAALGEHYASEGISLSRLPKTQRELMRLGRWFCDSLVSTGVKRRKGFIFDASVNQFGLVLSRIAMAYRTGRDIGQRITYDPRFYQVPTDPDGSAVLKSYKYRRTC